MDGQHYPIGTFADIAAIPEEALPRFLDELPEIIAHYRAIMAMAEMLATNGVVLTPEPPVWVDDDKRTATMSGRTSEGEEVFSFTHKMPERSK